MHIVMLEDLWHPHSGYMFNILSKYFVKFQHKVTIVTSVLDNAPEFFTGFFGKDNISEYDEDFYEKTGVRIVRVKMIAYISGRAVFSKKLIETVNSLKPDVLFCSGNDTLSAMMFIKRVGRLNYPVITNSSMLDMASANKFRELFRKYYRAFYTPKIVKYEIPVIRTQDDDYVIRHFMIPKQLAPWISYGSDTMLFYPDKARREKHRKENNISSSAFVVLYAGKLDEEKGGLLLAQAVKKKFNGAGERDVVIMIVGKTSGEYGRKVDEEFDKSENHIIRFPTQKYIDLAYFYQMADLVVFPRQCSLSFYDVQACGLPVLSEDNNINVDRCSHNNGWNFKSDDADDFHDKIERILELPQNKYNDIALSAYNFIIDNYNYETKAKEYETELLKVVKNYRRRKDTGC